MKRNSAFPVMIGISLALHGLVFFMQADGEPNTPPPRPESPPLTRVKLTRMVKPPPPKSVPAPVRRQEQKVVEKKPPETPPEPAPREEPELIAEAREGETVPADGEADGNREYEELLAYISGLIRQNLLYPAMARRRNSEGVVGMQFVIGKDGNLVSARVYRSSGSSILDKAALSLIERICPIKSGAIKRSMSLHINITYELTG